MMQLNSRKLISSMVFTLCAVSLVLAASLFYLIVPHLKISKSADDAQIVTNQILATTSADFAIFWHIDLESNTHRALATSSKLEENLKPFLDIVGKIEQLKFSASYGPEELHALISSRTWCSSKTPTIARIYANSSDYFKDHTNSYVCFIPVVNRSNSLIGKISVVWESKPIDQEIESAMVQIKGITAE